MTKDLIGVVGAGVMGAGVAEDLARHGFECVLIDVTEDALDRARATIRKNVRAARLLDRTADIGSPEEILASIQFSTDLADLADAELVIENATEDETIKEPIYRDLDRLCADRCIFIANTSCIPIAKFGDFANRPDRVIGVHFMNPVPMKRTVEVIPSAETSAETLTAVMDFLTRLGKDGVQVKDSPGFVSNRVLMVTINEAIRLVEEGIADAESVDRIFQSCFGHPMGPLATGDLIGLDTILRSLEVLLDGYGEDKYRPCDRLKQMVDANLHGRKTGEGFFKYA